MGNWTGKKNNRTPTVSNLAKIFTPRQPMCGPDYDPARMVVVADVPAQLKSALDEGMDTIGKDCLRQNAEVVFHLFESICTQHVLSQQMDHKLIRKLTRRDPLAKSSDLNQLGAEELSRSSLLGKDPYGDLPRPKPEVPGKKPASTEDGDGVEATAEPDTFSELQMLMMEVQDKTYQYLTAHLESIVAADVYVWVREEELHVLGKTFP